MEEKKHTIQFKESDISAFQRLYDRWSGKIYNFIMKMSNGNVYLAEEIVQDVFIVVWEKKYPLDGTTDMGSLLYTIAKNKFVNTYHAQLQRYVAIEDDTVNVLAKDDTTENDVNYHLLQEHVSEIINQLPPARKRIYCLHKLNAYSIKEIASQLNLSINTVESQLTKANAYVRMRILDYYNHSLLLLLAVLLTNP